MENRFYDELETLATYPLSLLNQKERGEISQAGKNAPSQALSDATKNKLAGQIDNFLSENEQYLSEHIHEVKIIEAIIKLRKQCDSLGIPWEKAHIVQVMKNAVGAMQPTHPIFINLPNDVLLPFFLSLAKDINDLKSFFNNDSRLRDVMSDPHAIKKMLESPFYEWDIPAEIAVDFLTEFAQSADDLTVDLSFCQDLEDTLLRKLAKSCPNIISINISGCKQISDLGIESFKTNHHLKHIYCFDCPKITAEETEKLRNLLPTCAIYG